MKNQNDNNRIRRGSSRQRASKQFVPLSEADSNQRFRSRRSDEADSSNPIDPKLRLLTSAATKDEARLVLPLMKTVADAQQLRQLEQDPFYLSAFMIQQWVGQALLAVTAEYAERKDPRTRALQSGQSWRSFTEVLGHHFRSRRGDEADLKHNDDGAVGRGSRRATGGSETQAGPSRTARQEPRPTDKCEADVRCEADVWCEKDIALFISDIFRFVRYEHPAASPLRKAIDRYIAELGDTTEELRKPVTQPIIEFQRICDWLDSVLHLQTHMAWHLAPATFDPDRDKRHLAQLGVGQRHFDKADAQFKTHWFDYFKAAATRFARTPKWRALGEALTSDNTRVWNYRDVDTDIITIWPLLKRHNWTYADLLNVIRPVVKRPNFYPCDTEQSISAYCINVLGLRKTGKGKTAKGELPGADVARRLLGVKG